MDSKTITTQAHNSINKTQEINNLVFQHMKQRRFAGIVEPQEQDLSLLLPQTQRRKDSV